MYRTFLLEGRHHMYERFTFVSPNSKSFRPDQKSIQPDQKLVRPKFLRTIQKSKQALLRSSHLTGEMIIEYYAHYV